MTITVNYKEYLKGYRFWNHMVFGKNTHSTLRRGMNLIKLFNLSESVSLHGK